MSLVQLLHAQVNKKRSKDGINVPLAKSTIKTPLSKAQKKSENPLQKWKRTHLINDKFRIYLRVPPRKSLSFMAPEGVASTS